MKIKEIQQLLILLLIAAIMLSFFHVLRINENPTLPTYDLYYHLNKIQSENIEFNLLKETAYPIDFILSNYSNKIFLMRLLPFIIGLLNVYLIYVIFREIIKDKKQQYITILIIILSPIFIYTHSVYNSLFLPLFFILLGILFVLKDRYFFSMISLFCALILNLNLFVIILFLLFVIYEKLKSKNLFFPVLGLIAASYVFITINNPAFLETLSVYFLLTTYISDFGALIGFGFFTLFLAAIGLILSWNEKNKNSILYYTLIALFICSLYDVHIILFIDLILSYYAGFALIKIWKSKWQSKILKNYVILLIICGLIFSAGSYLNRLANSKPNDAEILSLEWLNNQKSTRNILSYYDYGFLIESISGKSPYTDKNYFYNSKDKKRILLTQEIFQSRNLEEITNFFNKNKIQYIWINSEMKNGLVWDKNDEGILLILKNSQNFIKKYDYLDIEIWEYNATLSLGT